MGATGVRTGAPVRMRAVDAVLRDGVRVTIRAIHPRDGRRLRDFFAGLSPETLRLRFFIQHRVGDQEVDELLSSDGATQLHLAAFRGRVVAGVADYRRTTAEDAEISFVVSDVLQGRGLGSAFLRSLATAARSAGISCFCAETLERNEPMLAVFRHSGIPLRISSPQAGVVTVFLDLTAGTGDRAQPRPPCRTWQP